METKWPFKPESFLNWSMKEPSLENMFKAPLDDDWEEDEVDDLICELIDLTFNLQKEDY